MLPGVFVMNIREAMLMIWFHPETTIKNPKLNLKSNTKKYFVYFQI